MHGASGKDDARPAATTAVEAVKRICGLIPCYNEAGCIAAVVRGALKHLSAVIVVDDCSTDDTARIAKEAGALVVRHETNRGKGAALKTGFERAAVEGFEAVLTMDGDGQHDPDEIPAFLEAYAAGDCDVVLGCRRFDRRVMPLVRICSNSFTSWAVSRAAGRKISDSQTGFRLVRIETWRSVPLVSDRFDLESEFIIKVCRAGARIREVPIRTIYAGEKSKIRPLKDTWRFFSMLWKCR
ncbi:MAG: glycosyltransferase family 2 protein [Planctomycetota bacterium]|nr:glycosyltransferase family 2 protein [Planctomycetota bacterium]